MHAHTLFQLQKAIEFGTLRVLNINLYLQNKFYMQQNKYFNVNVCMYVCNNASGLMMMHAHNAI